MRKNKIIALIAFTLVLALASVSVFAASKTVTIKVEGMDCNGCSSSIEKALKATAGVEEVTVSLEKGEALIKYNDQQTTEAKLCQVINDTGYKCVDGKPTKGN